MVDINKVIYNVITNGYFALSNQKLYFLEFEQICNSAEEYKAELIKHAKKYKSYKL